MTAKPEPGERDVGGARPDPGNALTDAATPNTATPLPGHPACPPTTVLPAAMSWHANQAITRQVQFAYTFADLTRTNAEAMARRAETHLPAGPMRTAVTAVADALVDYADALAEAAMRFGRSFGHQAFAFAPAYAGRCPRDRAGTVATPSHFWSRS
jgi:hypothetical protein